MPSIRKLSLILGRTKGCCSYCGTPLTLETMTIDHMVPRSKGGSDDVSNLYACCSSCNTAKGPRSIEDLRTSFQLLGTPLHRVITPMQLRKIQKLGIPLPVNPVRKFWFEEIAA